ncbi:MAG: zinc dependent phospholipase C family protein [FCB group bacterium]|jgi:hypothetical protein
MPQPITHYLVIKNSLNNSLKDLWDTNNNFASLGSFGPDLFYTKDILNSNSNKEYGLVSDVMHWEASYTFFCFMLDYIKKVIIDNPPIQNKMKAFVYGYYSHVLTDVIFHPFIYRITGDHWRLHNILENELNHKKLEAKIDCFLLRKDSNLNPFELEYYSRIQCSQVNDSDKLDKDIFLMLKQCLKNIYENLVNNELDFKKINTNYHGLFEKVSDNDEDHPIHDAYHDFVESIKLLYKLESFLQLVPNDRLKALLPIKELTSEEEQEMKLLHIIGNNVGQKKYTFSDLFELAIKATVKIIECCEAFLQLDSTTAKEFFLNLSDKPVYLGEDFCLDSGLPCSLNKDWNLVYPSRDICYGVFTDEINKNYEKII